MINVLIISFNTCDLTLGCIESILRDRGVRAEVFLVDNGSVDETVQRVRERYPEVCIHEASRNLGYGGGANVGARLGDGEYLLITNTDVEYAPGSVSALAAYLDEHPEAGMVGPQQVFPDGGWQRSYGAVPGLSEVLGNLSGAAPLGRSLRRVLWPRVRVDWRPKAVPYVDGAIMMVRREAFEAVGGFDESFTHYAEEVDLCVRIQKAGWKTVFVPGARVMHVRGASSRVSPEKARAYQRKLVQSKLQFMRKHAAPAEIRRYTWLQSAHARVMSVAMGVGARVAPRRSWRRRAAERATAFRNLAEFWTQARGQPHAE